MKRTTNDANVCAAIAIAASLFTSAARASDITMPNAGFEQSDADDLTKPASWRIDGKAEELTLDKDKKYAGTQSLRVKFKEGAPYAGVIQRPPIAGVRGKTVQFSAMIARGEDNAIAGIWAGAWDKDKKRLAYVNTYESAAAKQRDWTRHQMSINIPKDAESVMVGVAIHDKDGVMWVDEVKISARE
jgi:hypothetical protein